MRKAQGGFKTYERGGKWWVRWSETNEDGKRYTARESLGLATDSATEQDADQVAAERLAGRIARRNDGSKASVTLAHAVEKFLATLESERAPKGTRRMYRQKCDRLLGHWHAKAGARRVKDPARLPVTLAELTPETVEAYFKARERELLARSSTRPPCGECEGCSDGKTCDRRVDSARSTLHKEWVALSRVVKGAAQRRELPSTVDRGTLKPSWVTPSAQSRERNLSPAELSKLLLASPANVRSMVALMVATGMRRGEAFRFQPADLDRKTWLLKVRGTKTAGAKRSFTVPVGLRPLLSHVTTALDPTMHEDAHKVIARASEAAGLGSVTCNDLRRTFGSWLVQGGTPLDVVARLMGHASTVMVYRVYGKHTDGSLAALAHVPAFTLSTPSTPSTGTNRYNRKTAKQKSG